MYVYTVIFSAMGYGSVVFILLLIKTSGATNAEIVKSCRKVFTIVFSFLLYAKPVETLHIVGGLVFLASVLVSMYLKMGRKKPAGYSAVPSREGVDANPDAPPAGSAV